MGPVFGRKKKMNTGLGSHLLCITIAYIFQNFTTELDDVRNFTTTVLLTKLLHYYTSLLSYSKTLN